MRPPVRRILLKLLGVAAHALAVTQHACQLLTHAPLEGIASLAIHAFTVHAAHAPHAAHAAHGRHHLLLHLPERVRICAVRAAHTSHHLGHFRKVEAVGAHGGKLLRHLGDALGEELRVVEDLLHLRRHRVGESLEHRVVLQLLQPGLHLLGVGQEGLHRVGNLLHLAPSLLRVKQIGHLLHLALQHLRIAHHLRNLGVGLRKALEHRVACHHLGEHLSRVVAEARHQICQHVLVDATAHRRHQIVGTEAVGRCLLLLLLLVGWRMRRLLQWEQRWLG
mmetsp:Transcript_34723/g.76377  ORF Transcript_34723/g.76377 Transcript_34723/m.76377 type:complete len:278 (+) Transcript_34723:555-1388(+)